MSVCAVPAGEVLAVPLGVALGLADAGGSTATAQRATDQVTIVRAAVGTTTFFHKRTNMPATPFAHRHSIAGGREF
jgi:hypothetical protein